MKTHSKECTARLERGCECFCYNDKPQHTPTLTLTTKEPTNMKPQSHTPLGNLGVDYMGDTLLKAGYDVQTTQAIVRAVNTHEELLRFAKEELARMKHDGFETTARFNWLSGVIAKAEGE